MDDVGLVLSALADPTRRAILESVRARPRSVNEIAAGFDVSRPAISQHLGVLQRAGLLQSQRRGRQHFYAVDLQGLASLRAYIEQFWDDVLSAFANAAAREAEAKKRGKGA